METMEFFLKITKILYFLFISCIFFYFFDHIVWFTENSGGVFCLLKTRIIFSSCVCLFQLPTHFDNLVVGSTFSELWIPKCFFLSDRRNRKRTQLTRVNIENIDCALFVPNRHVSHNSRRCVEKQNDNAPKKNAAENKHASTLKTTS